MTFASKVLLKAFSWEISVLVNFFVSDSEMQETLLETTFSLSKLPILPDLTTKQDSVKCVLHIKLCSKGFLFEQNNFFS